MSPWPWPTGMNDGLAAAPMPLKPKFIPLKGSGTIADQHFRPGEGRLVERAEPITGSDKGSAPVAACNESKA